MAEFEAKTVCVLGRQPALGLAELEMLYGAGHIQVIDGAALLNIESGEINFKRLGGTLKVAKILDCLPYTDWPRLAGYLAKNIPSHLDSLPAGKLRLGLSLYGIKLPLKKLNADMLGLKKIIRRAGHSARVVPNKDLRLNAASVLHNKLTHRGGWELLLVANGQQTWLAQTMFVQDIDDYAARDQVRPKRDAGVGMLPPKLAQIIINLATGQIEPQASSHKALATSDSRLETKRAFRVLDPFCGTGVILQEALLMGYSVIGSDIEPRMVEYSDTNVRWLIGNYPQIEGFVVIETADATAHRWASFSCVASETYLGRPLNSLPQPAVLKQIVSDVNTIVKKFLANLAPQLRPGQRLCLALPAWKTKNGFQHLPLIDHLAELGYNRLNLVHVKTDDLIYHREGQVVGRELLILERK